MWEFLNKPGQSAKATQVAHLGIAVRFVIAEPTELHNLGLSRAYNDLAQSCYRCNRLPEAIEALRCADVIMTDLSSRDEKLLPELHVVQGNLQALSALLPSPSVADDERSDPTTAPTSAEPSVSDEDAQTDASEDARLLGNSAIGSSSTPTTSENSEDNAKPLEALKLEV